MYFLHAKFGNHNDSRNTMLQTCPFLATILVIRCALSN
ncbi:hypothetical protein MGSAQ_000425 [marine sediment metagenome]|uniref:Uncharacterized protein n=1 Tax=marine sediment metagenome TaxID=412755 RepID=A0A1B6NXF4_9ZZZZ